MRKPSTFFWSDPHLGHAAMLQFCPETRQFSDESQMTEALIEAYRSVVGPDDNCIINGDFAHRVDENRLKIFFGALPGTKILVRGNHDSQATLSLPWTAQYDIMHVSIDSTRLVLCHWPMLSWMGSSRGALMLYGHHHGRIPANNCSMDIGVDVLGLAPVRLATIKAYLAASPPRPDPEGRDVTGGLKL